MLQGQEIWQYDLPPSPQELLPERPRRKLLRRRPFNERWKERDDRGWTLLHIHARRKGDLEEVSRLLDEDTDANVLTWGPKSHNQTPSSPCCTFYCSGLEWAYEIKRQQDAGFTGSETSCSSEN